MAKVKVYVSVVYAKDIEIEIPNDSVDKADIIEQVVMNEIDLLPESIEDFHYAWETYEEV